jgi:hypothetical protein
VHWAAIVTSIGAVLGGLAIVLAFVQLGAQRQDRLRAQVSRIGVWALKPEKVPTDDPDQSEWAISLCIRNSSELPVRVFTADLTVQSFGHQRALAEDGRTPLDAYAINVTRESQPIHFYPGTIAPEDTWRDEQRYRRDASFDMTDVVIRLRRLYVVVVDAAGRRWEMFPDSGSPPRLYRRRPLWWPGRHSIPGAYPPGRW